MIIVTGAIYFITEVVLNNQSASIIPEEGLAEDTSEEETDYDDESLIESVSLEDMIGHWQSGTNYLYIDEERIVVYLGTENTLTDYFIESVVHDHQQLSLIGQNQYSSDLKKPHNEVIDLRLLSVDEASLEVTIGEETYSVFESKQQVEDPLFQSYLDGQITGTSYVSQSVSEVTYDDFIGYWFPMESNDLVMRPLGDYTVYIGEGFVVTGYMQSSVYIDALEEFEIDGNTMNYTLLLDAEDHWAGYEFYEDFSLNVDRVENRVSLFKENDRDRLISHGSGLILQRVSVDEFDYYGHPYYDFVPDVSSSIEDSLAPLRNPENNFTENTLDESDIVVDLANYPFSIYGELTERDLMDDMRIINGDKAHPDPIDEDQAIESLFGSNYQATPSLAGFVGDSSVSFSVTDQGEYKVTNFIGQNTKPSPIFSLNVTSVEFENHVYTLYLTHDTASDPFTWQFFRVSDDVIYWTDESGQFTERYEIDAEWESYKFLPHRHLRSSQ